MALQKTVFPILHGNQTCAPNFNQVLTENACEALTRDEVTTLQINMGKFCNQACHHCHVEAGPKRREIMPPEVAERICSLLVASPSITTVDITGGAPELNPSFRWIVAKARALRRHIIDRCNLTVFFEPGMETLPDFLAENDVEIVASLPCYTESNVDQQRGRGVFEKSILALQVLNQLGYGLPGSKLKLNLVYNPLGAALPPPQKILEADYKKELHERFGIQFHSLFTLTNMPINRFAAYLAQHQLLRQYMSLLVNHFNPATIGQVMCRSLVSVSWDGKLYDCDFNQMLDMEMEGHGGSSTIWGLESFRELTGERIATGSHCFGCTAGAGSGCTGSLR